MKKILMFLVTSIFLISLVSAIYSQPGDIVALNYLTTDESSDLDYSDGDVKYLYCAYNFDSPNEELCEIYTLSGNCDTYDFNLMTDKQTCGDNYGEAHQITLEEGITTWSLSIVVMDMTFDENTNSWIMGTDREIARSQNIYKTIPAPESNLFQQIYERLKSLVCKIYNFRFCPIQI